MNAVTKTFTIKELEHFSGIKSHTLRMWEKRYNLLHPIRSAGNVRMYDLKEIAVILNVSLLNQNGARVSRLALLTTDVIAHKVDRLEGDANCWKRTINALIVEMYNAEPDRFERVLDQFAIKYSLQTLVEKIIYPFLKLSGLLWQGNKLFEEHLVVIATRKKLITAIGSEPLSATPTKKVLLFLPDNKQLDLGLLFAYYCLRKTGIPVLYLGTDVTLLNLKTLLQRHPPAYLFTYLNQNHHFPVGELSEYISTNRIKTALVIGQYLENPLKSTVTKNVHSLAFETALSFLGARLDLDRPLASSLQLLGTNSPT